jgi:hypothetical protein
VYVDHVVLAARNRAHAEQALDAVGLSVARGRALPGLGLSNLVVPLGRSLLEVHYPDGREPAPGAPPLLDIDRASLAARPSTPLVPVAWIVAYEDEAELRQLADRNHAPIIEAPEEGPGFPRYVLAGFGATFDRPWLPALIHWPIPLEERPAALPVDHRRPVTGIDRIVVSGPVEDIAAWCGGVPRGVHTAPGRRGPQAVRVGVGEGDPIWFGDPAGT